MFIYKQEYKNQADRQVNLQSRSFTILSQAAHKFIKLFFYCKHLNNFFSQDYPFTYTLVGAGINGPQGQLPGEWGVSIPAGGQLQASRSFRYTL